jgi:transcription-repair coupling factor (superfamily II helicase)
MASHVTVGGAPEGLDARLILEESERSGGPVLHVARDDRRLAAMQAALRFFDPALPVLHVPAWDVLPFDRCRPTRDRGGSGWRRSRR